MWIFLLMPYIFLVARIYNIAISLNLLTSMKKVTLSFIAVMILITSSLTGCFGSFGLTKKVYNANQKIGGKFLQTLVMYAFWIIPIYEIAGFLDLFIFNLIEFWSGANPMAMKAGESETQMARIEGNLYEITATQNQFRMRQLEGPDAGKEALLTYNTTEEQWYLSEGEKSVAMGKINFKKKG
jgi:hypothetical protein